MLFTLVLGAGCATVPGGDGRPRATAAPRTIPVFYATDRTANPDGVNGYGADRGPLSFGVAEVGIPPNHELGRNERPSVFRFEWDPDERKHIAFRGVQPLPRSDFLQQLRAAIEQAPNKNLLLFVHGYNSEFPAAARNLAQFATDLKFDGPILLFSWPSQGTLLGYIKDETNIEWAESHLAEVLIALLDQTPVEQLFLVAHSMGSRALTHALVGVANELPSNILALVRAMILIAPDLDADLFRRDVAPTLSRTGVHVTLYASSEDRALRASKMFHGYARAGDSGADLVLVPGIETVDASDTSGGLLGHSYFSEDRRIMEDIYALLLTGRRADQRFGLQAVDTPDGRYWTLRR
ncbi:MAG: alpha/beta fold hydrolase [Gammaproteobacteria bacterium]|nr:alpha/beta fold hydrolase [Gammaproteobacteria bacterium]